MSKKFSFRKSNNSKKISLKKNGIILKKKVEKKMEELYSNKNLLNMELDYDYDIDGNNSFIDKKKNSKKVNYELLDKLPKLECNLDNFNSSNENYFEDDDESTNSTNSKKNNSDIENLSNTSLDIDLDSLEQEQVGEKYYYFDYSKDIIYDLKYNSIGYIDEFGEIFIE